MAEISQPVPYAIYAAGSLAPSTIVWRQCDIRICNYGPSTMLERPLNLRDIPGEMPPQKLYDMNLQKKNLHAYGYASLTYKKIWQNFKCSLYS